MKKINKVIIITLVAILFTSGCSIFKINNDDKVDKTFKQFIEYINDNNSSKVKSLFAQNVQSTSKTLDDDIKYITNLIDGEIINWEENGNKYQSSSKEDGKISDMFSAVYVIETNNSKFYVYFTMYTINEINPADEGVKEIVILSNEQNYDRSADCYRFAGLSGIYNPNNDYSLEISNRYMEEVEIIFGVSTYENDMIATEPPWARNALTDYEKLKLDGQYFFDFTVGGIKSWSLLEGPITTEKITDGSMITTIESSYSISTNTSNEFVVYLLIYQRDLKDEYNTGLYSLRVESKESNISLKDAFDDTSKPGIYNPNNN